MSQRVLGWEPPLNSGKLFPATSSASAGSIAGNRVTRRALDWQTGSSQPANDVRGKRRKPSLQVVKRDLRQPLQVIADILVIWALGIAIGFIYNAQVYQVGLSNARDVAWTGLTVAFLFLVLERLGSDRQGVALTNAFDRLGDVARDWSLAFAGLLFILFALKASAELSRGFLLSFYVVGLFVVGAWRALTPPIFARWTHRFVHSCEEWVVIGDEKHTLLDEFVRELTTNERPAPAVIRFNACCDQEAWPEEKRKILTQTAHAARSSRDGAVYLCAAGVPVERLASICRALSILPVAMYILPDAATAGLVKCKALAVGSRIAVEVRRAPLNWAQLRIKRALDVALALVAIVGLSPVLLGVALAIKAGSKGPVLFRQTRTGLGGRTFRVYKFRTMHVLEDGPFVRQACRNDARVTRVGRFLRCNSLDELPQLLNVLKGEMSLVGPRPHAAVHDEFYAKRVVNYEVRQHVKPGITGWAQVHGLRGETANIELMQRRIEFDIWYATNTSLLLDCEILVRTLFEVCRKRNAY
jgi:Undecaprenyl-phosphate glucose phosphotransferase